MFADFGLGKRATAYRRQRGWLDDSRFGNRRNDGRTRASHTQLAIVYPVPHGAAFVQFFGNICIIGHRRSLDRRSDRSSGRPSGPHHPSGTLARRNRRRSGHGSVKPAKCRAQNTVLFAQTAVLSSTDRSLNVLNQVASICEPNKTACESILVAPSTRACRPFGC